MFSDARALPRPLDASASVRSTERDVGAAPASALDSVVVTDKRREEEEKERQEENELEGKREEEEVEKAACRQTVAGLPSLLPASVLFVHLP